MCNDISEILGIKVKNLKITQNLGLHVHKNVQALFYVNHALETTNNRYRLCHFIVSFTDV